MGKMGETEVDFIAQRPEEKIYIQVTESLMEHSVKKRELRSLAMSPDHCEKKVLSMDQSYITSHERIKLKNIIDFLLEG